MRLTICLLAVAAIIPLSAHAAAPNLPDHSLTPGQVDREITASNYRTYLCAGNTGKKLHTTDEKRPTSAYTTALKVKQLEDWQYDDKKTGAYEEDHLISLELGGDPKDEKNLWPQPYSGTWNARVKDVLEHELGQRICLKPSNADFLSLKVARAAVSGDWIASYKEYVCKRTRKPLSPTATEQCKLPEL